MAVDDTHDPLGRATRALREEDTAGWAEVSPSIIRRVRTLVTPAASLTVFAADGRAEHGRRGSTIRVSGRVLTPQIRAVIDTPTRAADSIDITVDAGRCAAIHIDLICSFGSDLQREGEEARAAVIEVVRSLLGTDPAFSAADAVTVQVVDVVDGDPHRA